ncbi:SDR family oxidoreductase [Kribbella sp. HUAS MG21]|uniref:SDR family oxidoreductase n=1 Tax=Kribbella sp. HUAS MG21 TaxID=3160966 RepID=A0AAU7TPD6_9ACTN
MLLVVGGTGDLGGRVVRLLAGQGHQVRCLVRDEASGLAVETVRGDGSGLGVETVRGDLTDPASLRAACQDVDTVVATATAIGRRLAGRPGPSIREVDGLGMLSLVDAAEQAGVRRFVYVSYAGVDAGLGTPLEEAKAAVEDRLRHSGLQRVVVRPDAFQEIHLGPIGRFDVANGKVSVIGRGDAKQRYVATDDIAALVAAVATEPDPPELIEVGGPEAISRNEAATIASGFAHRRVKVQRLPAPVARLAMRLLKRRNDGVASVLGAGLLQSLHDATWTDEPLRARGIVPRSASDFLRQEIT